MPTSNGTKPQEDRRPDDSSPRRWREVFQGFGTDARVDGDRALATSFRMYEFAGMAHIDSRDAVAYYPDPCKLADQPGSRWQRTCPFALSHLWQWG